MSNRRDNTGFTLVEMLVSLTIIAGILAMVYGSFAATTRSMDASGARLGCTERTCFALRLMTRQIRCAYAPGPSQSPPSGAQGTRTHIEPVTDPVGSASRASQALFRGNAHDPRGEVLSFVTGSGLGAGPEAPRGLFHVTYLYDRARFTLSISRRNQADSSDDRLSSKQPDLLLSNVTGIGLKFHDGRQWHPTWDIAQRHALPRAVKVEIAVTDGAGRTHSLGTTIPVVQEMHAQPGNTKRTVAAAQP